ncbi:MAG: alpha/beta fold hydrolase, partial [Thermodesulfobacteriota bacterium]
DAPFMVGHSMGGAVITLAAGKFGVTPRGMVLIEPIFLPSQLYNLKIRVEDHPLAGKSIRRKNAWSDLAEAKAYLRSKPLFARWDDEMLEMYLNHGFVESEDTGVTLACHPRREASLFMGSMAYDPWPLLPGIQCPVLLLEGETSENRAFIDLQKAAALFPNGQYRLVREAGHLIPMEKPAETISTIRDFFGLR